MDDDRMLQRALTAGTIKGRPFALFGTEPLKISSLELSWKLLSKETTEEAIKEYLQLVNGKRTVVVKNRTQTKAYLQRLKKYKFQY